MANDHVTTAPIEPGRDRPESLDILDDEAALGKGGMAVVRVAFDRELGRRIAYKQLAAEMMDSDVARRSFITEAQVTAQLDHPHIVPIYELGRHQARDESEAPSLYFTMKRVEGRTLSEIIREQPVERRTQEQLFALTQVFAKVCDAVAFAHSHGVIHRDLKPDNIMVGDFGQVYVLDWGIALIKRTAGDARRTIIGTPMYMSPEQAAGHTDRVDERSDIFALGACLYEILTGASPYGGLGESTVQIVGQALECRIAAPQDRVTADLPAQLSRVAMKAMSKDPDDRFATVEELKVEVQAFMQTYSFFPRLRFAAGTAVVTEGDPADDIYVMVEGDAEVVRNENGGEVHVRDLRSGDVFGEVAVFAHTPRTATVRAISDVTAVRISREQMSRDNEIGYWFNLFTKAIADRFLEKERQIAALERRLHRLTRKGGDEGA